MAAVHRHGFTRLPGGNTSDDQFSLNVIFVHGLRGHPRGTWETAPAATSERRNDATKKHKGIKSWFQRPMAAPPSTSTEQAYASSSSSSLSSSVFWPEQYLASDIPQARVWTYGYNADVIGGLFQANNKNSISQHGQDLSVRLERDIDNSVRWRLCVGLEQFLTTRQQPIVFVVHSLGGIIVKDAIRRSEKIRERTKLIIFLGTPHRGSAYAGWGQIASNLARLTFQDSNKKMIEALEVNSEVLDNIHEEFKTILFKGGIKIHSFQEARGISGMKGLDEKVVDDFSSKLDLPRTLETVESIDANHTQMAKYSSKVDQGYRAIFGVVRSFIQQECPDTFTKPGRVLEMQGKRQEAEATHQWNIEEEEKVHGVEHPDKLISISKLGVVLERQGKYKEAEAMQRQALEGRENTLGLAHPDTLTSVSQLGSVLERRGKYEEAEAMQRRALEGREEVLGIDHPDTLTSVSMLGSVLEKRGKYEEAEAMQRRALEGYTNMLGPEHLGMPRSASKLATVLLKQGKYEEAEAMHRRAINIYEKALGLEHPDTLISMANLALTLWSQGRWKEAEELDVQVIATRKRILGDDHPDTLTAMANLALRLKSQTRNEEAISLMDRCFQLRKRILGSHHPDTESSLETLKEWQMDNIEMG